MNTFVATKGGLSNRPESPAQRGAPSTSASRLGAFVLAVAVFALGVAAAFGVAMPAAAQVPRIGITQFQEHPALDDSRIGFLEAIEAAGYTIGEDIIIDYQNAQGDPSLVATIADKFVSGRYDMVFAIATPPLQAVAARTDTIPIVFAGIRDPIEAGVVESLERPGGNITGTSHWIPVSEQIKLVQEVMPGVERIGVLYNAGELNSVVQVEEARQWATSQGLTLVERTVTSTADVLQAAESLAGHAEVIFVPTDSTVVAAFESVVFAAERHKLPVVASDIATAARGAAAAYGADFLQLGRQAGDIALRILFEGADPATTPVETQAVQDLAVNVDAAARMGLTLPDEVLARARYQY